MSPRSHLVLLKHGGAIILALFLCAAVAVAEARGTPDRHPRRASLHRARALACPFGNTVPQMVKRQLFLDHKVEVLGVVINGVSHWGCPSRPPPLPHHHIMLHRHASCCMVLRRNCRDCFHRPPPAVCMPMSCCRVMVG